MRFKILLLLHVVFSFSLFSKDLPPIPNPPRLVNDYAGVLQVQESKQLEQKLRKYNDSSSSQITIVIENSLEGDDVFDYSFRLAEKWGIGQNDKNNGTLIYIALQDRKIRIQVGYGLEATLTDASCKTIIQELIKPAFKQGQYFVGLDEATSRIIAITKGEFKADAQEKKKGFSLFKIIFIIVVILLILSFFNKRGGGKTYSSSGSDWWTAAMIGSAMSSSGNRGGSSWGDFSSGGGSFGGFGGGGFGGGGAGGDW